MSVEALAVVLNHSRAKGTAKLVLLGIANHDGDGGAWPTVATLARYANTTARTVQRSVEQLVAMGELRVDVQRGGTLDWTDALRPNRYTVLVRCPAGCDRTARHQVSGQPATVPPRAVDNYPADRVTLASPGDAGVTGGGDTGVTQTTQVTKPPLQLVPTPASPAVHRRRPCRDHLGAGIRPDGECAGCWADRAAVAP